MTTLKILNEDNEVKCENCEVCYTVIWSRNPIYDTYEYCPFCGEEIDEFEAAN